MNAKAFNSESDIWIVNNSPDSYWWNELNEHSAFCLSHFNHSKKQQPFHISRKISTILEQTKLPQLKNSTQNGLTFVRSDLYFPNKWIVLVDDQLALSDNDFKQQIAKLKNIKPLRFFGTFSTVASLKASFPDAEFILEP